MLMKPRFVAAGVLITTSLALVLGGCGGQSPVTAESPTAPTQTSSAPTPALSPTSGGATVTGTVAVPAGPTGFTASSAASTSYTVVVSVSGTALQTTVDAAGRFKLTGVPAGTIQLKFSGNGMEGSITLTGVRDADQIEIAVVLSSSGASLAPSGDPAGQTQLEGRVAAINPNGTTNTLLVDSTMVSVPAGTVIRHGDTPIAFSALQVGLRVHVKGVSSGQVLVASEVIVQNTNSSVPVNATGTVSQMQPDFPCPAIRFTLSGWIVETSPATSFEKGACSSIADGTSVHVKGDVQSTGRVLATWAQLKK
jgi:hypothetical protein